MNFSGFNLLIGVVPGIFLLGEIGTGTTSFASYGTFYPSVPEPGTWALLITGFGLAGVAMRRRRTLIAA